MAEKDTDEGNSKKIVLTLEKKDNTAGSEASKPTAISEVLNLSKMTQYSRNLVSKSC